MPKRISLKGQRVKVVNAQTKPALKKGGKGLQAPAISVARKGRKSRTSEPSQNDDEIFAETDSESSFNSKLDLNDCDLIVNSDSSSDNSITPEKMLDQTKATHKPKQEPEAWKSHREREKRNNYKDIEGKNEQSDTAEDGKEEIILTADDDDDDDLDDKFDDGDDAEVSNEIGEDETAETLMEKDTPNELETDKYKNGPMWKQYLEDKEEDTEEVAAVHRPWSPSQLQRASAKGNLYCTNR